MRQLDINDAIVPSPDDFRFERYLRDSFAGLVARLRSRFSERVAAEDVVQEALLQAWLMDARGEEIRSLERWMTAAAMNLARSRWRAINAEDRALEKIGRDRAGDLSEIGQSPWDSDFQSPLARAIERLSLRQRQVVVLHYRGDATVRQIATWLDVSEGTVKRTLYDARGELRRSLGRDHQQPRAKRRQTMAGWHMAGSHPRQYEHGPAKDITYEGRPVAQLRSVVPRADGFGTVMQTFSAEHFLEQRVRFSGALKCKEVEDRVGLWMRVDGPTGTLPLAFDNMADRPIRRTTDWQRYEVVLDVPAEAQAIAFGVLLPGEGQAWMSAFDVETVGPEVQTTGSPREALPDQPQNLDFSEL